jgi:hypothetical protein
MRRARNDGVTTVYDRALRSQIGRSPVTVSVSSIASIDSHRP